MFRESWQWKFCHHITMFPPALQAQREAALFSHNITFGSKVHGRVGVLACCLF